MIIHKYLIKKSPICEKKIVLLRKIKGSITYRLQPEDIDTMVLYKTNKRKQTCILDNQSNRKHPITTRIKLGYGQCARVPVVKKHRTATLACAVFFTSPPSGDL